MSPIPFKEKVTSLSTRKEITAIENDFSRKNLICGTADGLVNIYDNDLLNDKILKACITTEGDEENREKEGKFRWIPSSPTKANSLFDTYGGKASKFNLIPTFQFKSHNTEFDYLESNYISEKIVCIEGFDLGNGKNTIIAANEKDIKVWSLTDKNRNRETYSDKIKENEYQDIKIEEKANHNNPLFKAPIEKYSNRLYREYKNVHQYNLSAIKTVPRTSQILSSDFLRVNLYDIEYYQEKDNSKIVNLIDLKPETFTDLQSVITTMKPKDTFVFAYGTSKGMIFFQDMRLAPKSENIIKLSELNKTTDSKDSIDNSDNNCDSMRSISDFDFYNDNYLIVRDLLGIKLIDLRSQKKIHKLDLVKKSEINSVIFNGYIYEKVIMRIDQNIIYSSGFEGKIEVIEIENNSMLKQNESIRVKDVGVVKSFDLWNDFLVCSDAGKLHFYK